MRAFAGRCDRSDEFNAAIRTRGFGARAAAERNGRWCPNFCPEAGGFLRFFRFFCPVYRFVLIIIMAFQQVSFPVVHPHLFDLFYVSFSFALVSALMADSPFGGRFSISI
jgi:hypothetical protein